MSKHKITGLVRRESGMYYFRHGSPKQSWISLRTRDLNKAVAIIHQIHLLPLPNMSKKPDPADVLARLSSGNSNKQFEIDLKAGIFKAEPGEDTQAMIQAVNAMAATGVIQAFKPSTTEPAQTTREVLLKTTKSPAKEVCSIDKAIEAYEKRILLKNKSRTVYTKINHIKHFKVWCNEKLQTVDDIDKPLLSVYQADMRTSGKTAKTIDNHFLTLSNFVKFCIDNGMTSHENNPAANMFILSKSERVESSQPYKEFTADEINKIFAPDPYKKKMTAPDFFWTPILAYYTGMRASEIGALTTSCFKFDPTEVSYIDIKISKTANGRRQVPIHADLITLGLETYVKECIAANVESLFPHRVSEQRIKEKRVQRRAQETFRGYLEELEIKEDLKSLHSFRVFFITQIADITDDNIALQRISGHTRDTSEGMRQVSRYVRHLPKLNEIVQAFKPKGVNLDLKGLAYTPNEFSDFLKGEQAN